MSEVACKFYKKLTLFSIETLKTNFNTNLSLNVCAIVNNFWKNIYICNLIHVYIYIYTYIYIHLCACMFTHACKHLYASLNSETRT